MRRACSLIAPRLGDGVTTEMYYSPTRRHGEEAVQIEILRDDEAATVGFFPLDVAREHYDRLREGGWTAWPDSTDYPWPEVE